MSLWKFLKEMYSQWKIQQEVKAIDAEMNELVRKAREGEPDKELGRKFAKLQGKRYKLCGGLRR